ncbi:MAG TPA: ATP-binding cassette domain-containing protein [Flavobacteriaceae bacterium]|nr:ATP-binding cassette domain-containing protein [Flavobacteriaceae bacterium]
MIKVEGLHKSFGNNQVLKGVSTEFNKGKTNLIIGQSGSGKTVFLKCMLGLIKPEKGSVMYNEIDFLKMTEEEQQVFRQQLGMVFQGSALFDTMNVGENVMFPLRMFSNKTREERFDRTIEVLKRVGLENVEDRMPSEISGGMQKRVAIARAIVNNPKYLFCDEPNSGLDPKSAIMIDNLIQEITHEYEITTVINTHDMNSVLEIGENIVFLKSGTIRWRGNNKELFKTDNEAIAEYVYSSDLFKEVREAHLKMNK